MVIMLLLLRDNNPALITKCSGLGRVVKATDLKSVGATFAGSNPADRDCF